MTEMQFDVPSFTAGGDQLRSTGSNAGNTATNAAASTLSPPGASSPVGAQIAMLTGQLQGGLAPAGTQLTTRATALGGKTESAMSAIQAQDAAGASMIRQGSSSTGAALATAAGATPGGDAAAAGGGAAEAAGSGAASDAAADIAAAAGGIAEGDLLNPESIDQEARDKAQQMLSGDQMTSQMGQMVGQAAQAGAQASQQLSQQLNQVGQQMGQVFQQASQQIGQMVGKAGQSLSTPSLDLDGLDSLGGAGLDSLGGAGGGGMGDFGGGAGDFGGGGMGDFGGSGGFDPGAIDETANGPTPAMTTSAALTPSPLTPPATNNATSSTAAAARAPMMPMMPMMPMAGMGNQGAQDDKSNTRDPVIFAEGPLYEPPTGVEQTFGAIPAIETEEPPFGTAEADASAR